MTNRNERLVVEIDELIAVSNSEPQFEAYCSGCRKMADMATPKTASALAGISERELFRAIEEKAIHFTENPGVHVCLESLRNLNADSSTASAGEIKSEPE